MRLCALFPTFNLLLACCCLSLFAQSNIHWANTQVDNYLTGQYDPTGFQSGLTFDDPMELAAYVDSHVNGDSIQYFVEVLSTFGNRNTGSDTVSNAFGIGAARRWVYAQFKRWGQMSNGKLIPTYLQFDEEVCGVSQHRNVVGVVPGVNTSLTDFIVVEAHLDSRCEDGCDSLCMAEGVEDNASGSALVMELARVLSGLNLDRTVVLMLTTGEEQGLVGGRALARYASDNDLKILGVFNNDVIGSVTCGETSSPPSCPGQGDIDSLQVRLFSSGSFDSFHKSMVRWIKLQYEESLNPVAEVPMTLTIMSAEDRTGRGGDHIPFRQLGFTAMRFTSANEHGDGGSDDPNYHDRQHSRRDILGEDTDGDMIIDSFYVNFNYLTRNTVINGVSVAIAACSPAAPTNFEAERISGAELRVSFSDPSDIGKYRLGVRPFTNHNFDSLITLTKTTDTVLINAQGLRVFSVCAVDENGMESFFSNEVRILGLTSTEEIDPPTQKIQLLQNRPNPFDESTFIHIVVPDIPKHQEANLRVSTIGGKEIWNRRIALRQGMNEILYEHGYGALGTYIYQLIIDGQVIDSKKMVFAY